MTRTWSPYQNTCFDFIANGATGAKAELVMFEERVKVKIGEKAPELTEAAA